MNEQHSNVKIGFMVDTETLSREILQLSIPIVFVFAISGMDWIGYFIFMEGSKWGSYYLGYTRSITNVMLGFLFTTISLFILPIIVNKTCWKKPLAYFGTQAGNKKIGLLLVGISVFFIPLFFLSSNNESLIATYPMAKDVLVSWPLFILYEITYILFYYIPYEFYFRGILQQGLSKTWKPWQSILYVTMITTLLHATKPLSEIALAFVAGIFFGIVAEKLKSWYYVFCIHAIAGVSIDIFCGLRYLGAI